MLEVPGYRIEGEAGRGGWSVVYRAVQLSLNRPVALKVIADELASDPGFRARFKRECEIAASLDHPHVVPVYDAGEAGERLYVAMRWVDGTDLAALAPLEPSRAARIVAQVGGALDAAHARGLVHRDVKPGNVLVESRPDGDHAYLTDFGLTKEISPDPGLTEAGRWLGTVDFAAPEQIRGQPTDARSDVYSLGCVLGFALTGAVPYPRPTPEATMQAHLHEPPPQLPPPHHALSGVLARALAKDPSWRFQSAGDLGRAALAMTGGALPRSRARSVVPVIVAVAAVIGAVAVAVIAAGDDEGEPTADEDLATETAPPDPSSEEIVLQPERDGDAFGSAFVVQDSGRPALDVEADVPRPPRGRTYELWLYNSRRDAISLGTSMPSGGRLQTRRRLPDGFTGYAYVDISLEPPGDDGRHSGRSVLRGALSGATGAVPGP